MPSTSHPGSIQEADITNPYVPEFVLSLAASDATVVRGPPATSWDRNTVGISPEISAPMQFIRSDKIKPLVASGDHILVGEVERRGRRIVVVADPDLLANAGLAKPVDAAFALALIRRLRTGSGPVVFDEALAANGGSGPNILKYLFRFPLLAALVPGLVALVLLLWSAIPRFGAAEPQPPALKSGKRGLIRNVGSLMIFAGNRALIVRRLVDATVHDVATRLHAPSQLKDRDLAAWLGRVGAARGVGVDFADIALRAEASGADRAALVVLALDLHLWKQEILRGP